jgi:putative endonuclease
MDDRKKRGDRGENAVAEALERSGHRILERQYRCRWGEIDLIALSPEGVLCFVEVKTRSPRAIAAPREAVTPAKQRRLRDAASWYLAQTERDGPCRFDVAEVYPADAGGRRQINYITSAF